MTDTPEPAGPLTLADAYAHLERAHIVPLTEATASGIVARAALATAIAATEHARAASLDALVTLASWPEYQETTTPAEREHLTRRMRTLAGLPAERPRA